jgi:6,7-dimethyl-8-ribityllumazine synthase
MQIINVKPLETLYNIAIVVSRFNEEVTERLLAGALQRLAEFNVPEENITVVWVPGAVEIPLAVQRLARLQHYEAIITLGAVIRGETTHYDYVCNQVSSGCQKIALEHNLPVIFGILTTENEQQAMDRVGGAHGHKGQDAVDAAIHMIAVLRQI